MIARSNLLFKLVHLGFASLVAFAIFAHTFSDLNLSSAELSVSVLLLLLLILKPFEAREFSQKGERVVYGLYYKGRWKTIIGFGFSPWKNCWVRLGSRRLGTVRTMPTFFMTFIRKIYLDQEMYNAVCSYIFDRICDGTCRDVEEDAYRYLRAIRMDSPGDPVGISTWDEIASAAVPKLPRGRLEWPHSFEDMNDIYKERDAALAKKERLRLRSR